MIMKGPILFMVVLGVAFTCYVFYSIQEEIGIFKLQPNSMVGEKVVNSNVKQYNTPVGGEMKSHAPDLLDLDPEELFNRTVIVTGFSENHFIEAKGMIGSAQRHLPHTKIIVYDLGLGKESLEVVKRMCNVQVRHFDKGKYPAHVSTLTTYAFKPIIVQGVLNEFDVVFWCDASVRFQRDPRAMYPYLKEQKGLMGRKDNCTPELMLPRTNPRMFKALGVDMGTYKKDCQAIGGGHIIFVNTTLLRQKIVGPWVDCALRHRCIEPINSVLPINNHGPLYTHRFDQSALSIIAYKNNFMAKNTRIDVFKRVIKVSGTHQGAKTVQFCKKL